MSFRTLRHPEAAPASPPAPEQVKESQSARHTWLLIVCCVAQFMVILDLTIVNVALPSIQDNLGFSSVNLQWVVDAYAIVFAGFLMLGGRVSDRFGRRESLVAALTLFALASLAGGAALDQQMLVAARAVQGLSGALMAAASLAAITAAFPPGPARHRAIGLWGAMNGAGGAAGALFGGVITQELGWRWVLLINPPIGIAAAVVAYFVIVDHGQKDTGKKFDIAGALTLTIGQVILAYGFVNGGNYGWLSFRADGPIVLGLVILVLFTVIEARWASAPLVPFKQITKTLKVANGIVLAFSAALFPMWYVSSLYLQQVLGLSPLEAGLAFFPMALVIFLVAQRAGKLVGRFGVRTVLASGLIMMASGMLLLARIGPSGSAIGFVVFPGLLVAAGIGMSIVPSTIVATQGAGPAQAGLASGLVNTSRQVGGAVGIALLISLATTFTSHLIGENKALNPSLTDGFRLAYFIQAGLVLLAAVITLTRLPRHQQAPAAAPHAPAPHAPAPQEPAAEQVSASEQVPPAPDAPPQAAQKARRKLPALPVTIAAVIVAFFAVDYAFAGAPGAPIGAYSLQNSYSFVTQPSLHPPMIFADEPTVNSQLEPGYILLAPFYDLGEGKMEGQSGPLLLNNKLQPVWFKPVPTNVVASNLEEQTYEGQPVLSWWQGVISNTGATGSGEYVVVNRHYQTVATLKGADGWILTLHSMIISGGDAWVTANKDLPANLGNYGGVADGALTDSAVQEYNLKTGKLIKSWDALKHVPLSDSHANPPGNGFPWDAYHVNSISLNGNGTMLVSMRNTWALYDINMATGKIIWTLGGRHSSFKVTANADFQWQHDATLLPNGEVTVFDDHCCQISGAGTYLSPDGITRALVLKLDLADHTASVVRSYLHDSPDPAYMGSTELLSNGNVFVGWGQQPYFSEYSKSGRLLLDGLMPGVDLSYRAIQVPNWIGSPTSPPAGAVRISEGITKVYASWNGDTEVTSWRVLAGPAPGELAPIVTKPKSGFETAITVKAGYRAFEVQALNSKGQVIGTSKPFS